jgi:competence protein ComEC
MRLAGRVTSFPLSGRYGTRFDLRAEVGGRTVTLAARAVMFDVWPGDSIVCDARVTPRGDDAYLVATGKAGYARIRMRDVRRWQRGPAWRHPGWRAHHAARTRLTRRMGNDAALPLALLLGERGHVDRPLWQAVERLGIVHLLALSGMHLGLVAGAVLLLARVSGVRPGLPLAVSVVAYASVVGEVSSLWRACLMALLLVAAGGLLRPRRPLDALGGALFVMLLHDPLSARAAGLQLSFAATFAVLMAARHWTRSGAGACPWWRRVLRGAAGVLVVSVAVEIVIAPLLAWHFGRMSVVGPIATTLFVVPVAMVQALSLLTAAAAVLGVDAGPAWLVAHAAELVRDGAIAAATVAPPPLALPAGSPPLYWAGVALAARFWRRPEAWLGGALLAAVSFVA